MKNLKYTFIALIGMALLTNTSCKKDDGNNDGFSNMEGCNASWKVDGVDYSSSDMAGCLYLDNTLNLSTNLTGGEFHLQIDPITSAGTYVADATDPNLNVVILLTLSNGTLLGISNGSVIVSELSASKAKGTFSGNFYDISDFNQVPDFSVTNGSFEVDF